MLPRAKQVLVAILLVVWTGRVGAAPSRAETLLTQGLAEAKKKQYPRAIRAFKAALAASPYDPVILAELGLAQFRAGQLDEARVTTTQAIAHGTSADQRAAAEYNLGRIEEQATHWELAGAAYKRSLALRPNAIVAQRADALTKALLGPSPAFRKWMESFSRKHPSSLEDWWTAQLEAKSEPHAPAATIAQLCANDGSVGYYLVDDGAGKHFALSFDIDGRSQVCSDAGVPHAAKPTPPLFARNDRTLEHAQEVHRGQYNVEVAMRHHNLVVVSREDQEYGHLDGRGRMDEAASNDRTDFDELCANGAKKTLPARAKLDEDVTHPPGEGCYPTAEYGDLLKIVEP